MPKVLIFAPIVGRGGLHLCVETMLKGYRDYAPEDWQFSILGHDYDEIGLPIQYGYPLTKLESDVPLPQHPFLFPYLLRNADHFMDQLREVVDEQKPDLVMVYGGWWIARAKRWDIPTPMVCFLPDFATSQGVDLGQLLNDHFEYSAQLLSKRADFTVYSSDYHREHAVSRYHFPIQKTAVVHHSSDFVLQNGLKVSKAEGRRVRKKLLLPEKYVLAFHPMGHKDPQTVLRAQQFARMHSDKVPSLVFAGIGTDGFTDLKNRRTRRMLEEVHAHLDYDFFATGYVDEGDIGGLFANAVVSINASMSEGDLSGATLTSFVTKTPHIYSNLPVYQLRLNETLGLSFEVGDYEQLGKHIVDVCEYPEAAERRALRAFKWAQTRTLRDVINEYLEIFRKVIDEPPSHSN